jgi:UDP-N-acetylmuramoylalanine--D-glutamate ligase
MDCSPQIAVILNITPNHLDRHGTMEAYTAAKARVLDFQSEDDWAVLGRDDPGAWALADRAGQKLLSFGFSDLPDDGEGVWMDQGTIFLRRTGHDELRLLDSTSVALRGRHNMLNVMAACTIAAAAGLPAQAMRAGVEGFQGVAHRLEFVRMLNGAAWYNDSIATAPERAMAAVRAFDEPLVLLAGGRDKDLPWHEFAELVDRRVRDLILFGEAAEIIVKAIEALGERSVHVIRCESLKEAVAAAAETAQPGDVVLLSPGGTSFDEFYDFEERGVCFAQWVNELK